MKKFKTIITTLAAAALFLLPAGNCLKASADGPVTYAVRYLDSEGKWCFQANSSEFSDSESWSEIYYLQQDIKDGDLVVVDNTSANASELNLGSVRLSNLTVKPTGAFSVVRAGGYDEVYVLPGASCSVNGDVTTAHVYDAGATLAQFNGNIGELRIHAAEDVTCTIGCSGTVGHLYAPSDTLPRTFYDLYNFAAGSLQIKLGSLQTPESQYSQAPSAAQQTSQAQQTPQVQQGSSQTASSDDSEYDEVPKTGDAPSAAWLLCPALLCAAGSLALRKNGR